MSSKKIKYTTNAQRLRMAEMREDGYTYREIAEEIGCSLNTVAMNCIKQGAERPDSNWKSHKEIKGPAVMRRGNHVVRRYLPEEDVELLRLEAEGLRIAEISRRTGRKVNSIIGRLRTLARKEERSLS